MREKSKLRMANGTRIEKLDDSNYESWKMDVESLLIYDDLWEYTSGETLKPAEEKNASVWITKDRKARACIWLALSKSQKSHVMDAKTSKEVWDTLQKIHQPKGPARKIALFQQLLKFRKSSSSSMAEHVSDFTGMVGRLSEVGAKFEDDFLATVLLSSLPEELENFRVAVSSRDDMPKLADLKIKITEESDRKKEKEDPSASNEDAFFAKRKKTERRETNRDSKRPSKFNGKCFKCGEYGHRAMDCEKGEQTANVANYGFCAQHEVPRVAKSNAWKNRRFAGKCFECGKYGHRATNCWWRKPNMHVRSTKEKCDRIDRFAVFTMNKKISDEIVEKRILDCPITENGGEKDLDCPIAKIDGKIVLDCPIAEKQDGGDELEEPQLEMNDLLQQINDHLDRILE